MRINKSIATEVARKLTEKHSKACVVALADYQKAVTAAYKKQIPAEVVKMQKKHPEFFETSQSVCLIGHGFNYEYVALTERLIKKQANNRSCLELTTALAKEIMACKLAADKAKETYKQLFEETETALVNLRTFANIEKHLPEAVKYLPKSTSLALIPDLNKLRDRLVA